MSNIAIIGPGAIGSTVGAAVLEAGHHAVVFCGNRPFSHVHVSFPTGLPIDLAADVRTTPEDLTPADWVFVCVKAHQTASAVPWFRALVGSETRIAVLQNGIEHRENVQPYLAESAVSKILPVVVQIPARLNAPGNVTLPSPPHLVVPASALGDDFAALFTGTRVPVKTTSEFTESLWKKLCLNATNGSITALTCQPESVFQMPVIADLARKIILECVSVGRAEGARLEDSLVEEILANLTNVPADDARGNSMYFDRIAGRPLEADARNGVVVRLGKKHGIPTPVNETLFALLQTFAKTNNTL